MTQSQKGPGDTIGNAATNFTMRGTGQLQRMELVFASSLSQRLEGYQCEAADGMVNVFPRRPLYVQIENASCAVVRLLKWQIVAPANNRPLSILYSNVDELRAHFKWFGKSCWNSTSPTGLQGTNWPSQTNETTSWGERNRSSDTKT